MRYVVIGLPLAAMALAGAASAQSAQKPDPGAATVTRAEALSRAAALFDRLDANHDGKLDAADREARMAARMAERRKAMFDRLDANHDGMISRDEFNAMRPPMAGPGMIGRDMGGQGMGGPGMGMPGMGRPGLNGRRMGPGGSRPDMQAPMMRGRMPMPMADSNHDRAISKDEFIAAAASRFDAADSNHDGKLTPEERRAARAAMRGMMQPGMPGGAAAPPPAKSAQ